MLNRREQVVMQRWRTGHAGVLHYLHWFNVSEKEICEFLSCKTNHIPETFEHYFLRCPAHNLSRTELFRGIESLGIIERDFKHFWLGTINAEINARVQLPIL